MNKEIIARLSVNTSEMITAIQALSLVSPETIRRMKQASMEHAQRLEEEAIRGQHLFEAEQLFELREVFKDTPLSFSIQSEPVRTLQEILDDANSAALFPELEAEMQRIKKDAQLHKKKGKKVKNWEHNKHWQGRKKK